MACVENIPPKNADSEMEEGEIIDELDELSDISSEEEFLLRQRLQVLENYNNVLERKKAKRSSIGPGKQRNDTLLHDLSEISATDLEDTYNVKSRTSGIVVLRNVNYRHLKSHHKQKKRKDLETQRDTGRNKDFKKRGQRKKRTELIISESSEDSDDEYRNKRRKLANAVIVHREKNDTSSLQDRLQKMLYVAKTHESVIVHKDKNDTSSLQDRLQNMFYVAKTQEEKTIQNMFYVAKTQEEKTMLTVDKETEIDIRAKLKDVSCSPLVPVPTQFVDLSNEIEIVEEVKENTPAIELVDLCTDDDVIIEKPNDAVDSVSNDKNREENKEDIEKDSDEDLELLRQHALKTKASKATLHQPNVSEPENKPIPLSDDEDSDTAELRLICLKSALLKKAIEMKRKQKLQKRLSQSSNLQDELFKEQEAILNKIDSENNNTDIESVDMDIGSDADEKGKESSKTGGMENNAENNKLKIHMKAVTSKEDELDEDEDLLRARLLTSLSKNLPHLVDPNILKSVEEVKSKNKDVSTAKSKVNVPEARRIVINVGESDSEGEHEATKNLTKMHMKLSEQVDFQQKLDMFLKSTRMEVEKSKEPDVQKTIVPKPPQKYVAKVVNHLPKSEQMEYKNLVKRMAELEKIKQARQSPMNLDNRLQMKETLKPRNVSVDPVNIDTVSNNLEEQIASSRKTIAEESSKMLKLREEATKLTQKYKIVSTELRNITTAINLNRKEQRSVQIRLSKIRGQHQRLLNSATSRHSKINGHLSMNRTNNKIMSTTKLQKENDPTNEEHKSPLVHKSLKVSFTNDLKDDRLSVQIDVNSNKKTGKIPVNERIVDIQYAITDSVVEENIIDSDSRHLAAENGVEGVKESMKDDYESPLQALGTATWEGDPNAILCPFEVGGNCKDPDCKYVHPKISKKH